MPKVRGLGRTLIPCKGQETIIEKGAEMTVTPEDFAELEVRGYVGVYVEEVTGTEPAPKGGRGKKESER